MILATLRLFNAIEVTDKKNKIFSQAILERTVRNGYVLDPAIQPESNVLDTIERVVGISGEKANAAFHKSWSVIQDSSLEFLVIQQIIHYITTYGFEQLGIYRQDAVYIPHELLELPAVQNDISLVVIKALDAQEILDRIINLGSGISLAQQTLDDMMTIVKAHAYDKTFVSKIRNRELKTLLYDFYGLVPQEPVEFLRYLISKLTGESLLIKNDYLIDKIKQADGEMLDAVLKEAPEDLPSIFLRFKPLFLAMKTISKNKTYFNQLRKKANTLHKPLPEDYFNSVTAQTKRGEFKLNVLEQNLKTTSTFRKIRLAYALKQRTHSVDSTVYRVRNGRGWATAFEWPDELEGVVQQALNVVLNSITNDIRENVSRKTIYIPANIHYALPATEKQFTGYLPNGSFISVPHDMIVGIHWTNTDKRIDLDLSVIRESGKIGWDVAYRSNDKAILFSGDMTDAPLPNGASELFYLRQGKFEPAVLMLNYFNFRNGDEVSSKILVANETPQNFGKNYMVNVNNIIASANIKLTRRQNILGLIVDIDDEKRFYFSHMSLGNSITSTRDEHSTHARKYLISSLVDSLDFRAMLSAAGANVVNEIPNNDYLDLSPEKLDKSTIINLINPPLQRT